MDYDEISPILHDPRSPAALALPAERGSDPLVALRSD